MPDREKVINKVTAIVADMQEEVDEWKDYSDSELRGGLTCDCDWWYKTLQTLNDALALLKAQEPVEPRVGHDGWYRCGSCSNPLASGDRVNSDGFLAHPWPRYCEMCGRAVKWE